MDRIIDDRCKNKPKNETYLEREKISEVSELEKWWREIPFPAGGTKIMHKGIDFVNTNRLGSKYWMDL